MGLLKFESTNVVPGGPGVHEARYADKDTRRMFTWSRLTSPCGFIEFNNFGTTEKLRLQQGTTPPNP